MNIINKKILEEAPSYYSISRIKKYDTCSEAYRLRYHEKIYSSKTKSLVIGVLVHNAIEKYYTDQINSEGQQKQLIDYLEFALSEFLVKDLFKKEQDKGFIEELIEKSLAYAKDVFCLFAQAKPEFITVNNITKNDGQVAKNPTMTSKWKQISHSFNLIEKKQTIEKIVQSIEPEYKKIEFSDAIAETYAILFDLWLPKELDNPLYLEFPISEYNQLTKELINEYSYNNFYVNGYIDWLGKIEGKYAVIDYKSSKSAYVTDYLPYNAQLNFYAAAASFILNKPIEYIGIYNIRENSLVISEIDKSIQTEVLEHFFSKIFHIEQELFNKHLPETKYSPCLNTYNKPCEYLSYCYPFLGSE